MILKTIFLGTWRILKPLLQIMITIIYLLLDRRKLPLSTATNCNESRCAVCSCVDAMSRVGGGVAKRSFSIKAKPKTGLGILKGLSKVARHLTNACNQCVGGVHNAR